MIRRLVPLVGLTILLTMAAPVHALDAGDCSDSGGAAQWWSAQEPRTTEFPQIHQFWSAVMSQLQIEAIEETRQTCQFLDDLLLGIEQAEQNGNPEQGARTLGDAASIGDALSPEVRTLAMPALVSAGERVGSLLEEVAKEEPVTRERIDLVRLTRNLYRDVGLEGSEARVQLWLDAEKRTYNADINQFETHMVEADKVERSLNTLQGTALNLGRVPGLIDALRVDQRLMATHGEDENAQKAEAQVADLQAAQEVGVQNALLLAAITIGVSLALFAVLRVPSHFLERDLKETEIALTGVPV